MNFLSKYLPRIDFDSYEDFKKNYKLNVPENFNFGYDIVDEYARLDPEKPALIWLNDDGGEKHFTFADVKEQSDRIANVLASLGIKKGDRVLLILKQRPEVWFTLVALCKLGATSIPATFQLTEKDIIYRCEAAEVKMLIAAEDDVILGHIRNCREKCTTLRHVGVVGDGITERYGDEFLDMRKLTREASAEWIRPTGDAATQNMDPMLMYFTSGTSGMPKMLIHNFVYPLGIEPYWIENENERKRQFSDILRTGTRPQIIGIIRSVYEHSKGLKDKGRKLHACDEQACKDAEKIIYEELSYVLEIERSKILDFIISEVGEIK